jgi:chorismate dehydratase
MLRVGVIDYVNMSPLFHALRTNIISHNATFSFGAPEEINRQFLKKELDVASISAAHFLDHRLEYVLLSDLGLAATQEVMSIRLFSKKKPNELDGATLFLPTHSASSVTILKKICKHFWKINPVFCPYSEPAEALFSQDHPFLVIGDECLILYEKHPEYPSLDLAQAWHSLTDKALCLAVIATRNDAFISKRHEVIEFQKCVENSFLWAQNNMPEIIKCAALKTGCTPSLLEKYYSIFEYQLTPKHFHGLNYLAQSSF